MKNNTVLVAFWLVFFIALLACTVAVAQDSTRTQPCTCPCDSAFVRRANYRFDRQFDHNSTIYSTLKDQAEMLYILEKRIDSLRSLFLAKDSPKPAPRKAGR